MILAAVDVGNTRAHIGLFQGSRLLRDFHVPSERLGKTRFPKADIVAIAAVRPVRGVNHPGVVHLGRDFPAAIENATDRPSEAGFDRLANAVAAKERGAPCIVVDVGTAVTFDVVDRRGRFIGGLIAPGMEMGSRALHRHTARLPQVKSGKPKRVIGRRTKEAIESGLYWSVAGLIESGIRETKKKVRGAVVLGTGGQAALFRSYFDRVVPTLTLEGIRISYVRHRDKDNGTRPRRHRRR